MLDIYMQYIQYIKEEQLMLEYFLQRCLKDYIKEKFKK